VGDQPRQQQQRIQRLHRRYGDDTIIFAPGVVTVTLTLNTGGGDNVTWAWAGRWPAR